MPEMDGLAATRAIRERQRDGAAHPNYRSRILIIAMTALAQQSDRESCLAAGMDDYLAKPIRPADVRNTIERWAPLIHAVAAPAPPAADTAAGAAKAGDLHSPDRQPPVDMSRLLDLTEGNPDSLRDLVAMFYRQTTQQLNQIEDAVRANQPAGVGHVAHSCKGACATLGMTRLAAVLLDLEKLGKSGGLTGAEPLCAGAWREFKEIQAFFAGHSAFAGAPPAP